MKKLCSTGCGCQDHDVREDWPMLEVDATVGWAPEAAAGPYPYSLVLSTGSTLFSTAEDIVTTSIVGGLVRTAHDSAHPAQDASGTRAQIAPGASHPQGHGALRHPDQRGTPSCGPPPDRACNGYTLADSVTSLDEITYYKFDNGDEEQAAPDWDSEEESSDLDPWLADSSEGEKWTDVCNRRRGGRVNSPVAKSSKYLMTLVTPSIPL